jgi:hypothetical protein
MPLKLNLLVETPFVGEKVEIIEEENNRNAPNTMYIKGPYMMAEGINKNKRLYPIDTLREEVQRYNESKVKTERALGELNHPPTADVDLTKACHLVTELYEDNNVFYGKSKILSTPAGLITKSLINDGVSIGISSRMLGTLNEQATHNVVENMNLVALDVVADPSFDKAFVNGILESKQWVLAEDGKYEESYDRFEKSISNLPGKDVDTYLREQILTFISKL